MAFGKSHRDPYATSVGHLIGKEARGVTSRLAWETAGALRVPLHSPLGVGGGRLGPSRRKCYPPPQLSHATCVPPAATFHFSGFGSLIPEPLRKKMQSSKCWASVAKQVTCSTALRGVLGPLGVESGNFLTRGRFFIKCVHSQHLIVIPILQTRKRVLRR